MLAGRCPRSTSWRSTALSQTGPIDGRFVGSRSIRLLIERLLTRLGATSPARLGDLPASRKSRAGPGPAQARGRAINRQPLDDGHAGRSA